MAEGRAHPRGEQFSALNSQLSQAVGHFTQLLSSATAFGQAVNQFRTLETQLALTNAAAGGTVTTFKQMEVAARQFALATTASAQESASALYFLAQAGYSVEQSMNALAGVMILAQATMQDVGFTSDLIASTLMTYSLTSLDAARVANLFAAAQMNSLASLDKLAFSLRQVGPVASAMGQEIETTTAYLAELYNVGLRGEQAGTALRNIMVRLIDPPKEAREVLTKYGIAVRDTTGQLREMEDVMQDLYKAGIGEAEAAALFGVEALAGGLTLIRSVGTGAFDKQRDAISGTGAAFEMAAAQLETLDGALKLARNSVNDLFISFGQELAPVVVAVAGAVRDVVSWFNSLSAESRSLIMTTTILIGGFVASMAALKAIGFIFGPLTAGLKGFFGAFQGAGAAGAQVGILTKAFIALRSAMSWVFLGGAASMITSIGTAITGLTPAAAALIAQMRGLSLLRFAPLVAGLGAVGLAITATGGLIWAITAIGAAWAEQTRMAEVEIAKQRSLLLEAAGIAPTAIDNLQGRHRRRETTMSMASSLPTLEQVTLFRGNIDSANDDLAEINKMIADYQKVSGGLLDLEDAIIESRETARGLIVENAKTQSMMDSLMIAMAGASGSYATGAYVANEGRKDSVFNVDAENGIRMLQEQVRNSTGLYEDVIEWVAAQFDPSMLSNLEGQIAAAQRRKQFAESQMRALSDVGDTTSDQYKEMVATVAQSDDVIKNARNQLDRIEAGTDNDATSRLLNDAISARDTLEAAIDAVAGREISAEEGKQLTRLQGILDARNKALADAMIAELTAARQNSNALDALATGTAQQAQQNETALYAATENLVRQLIGGEGVGDLPVNEIFASETETFRAYLAENRELAITLIRQIMLESEGNTQDDLFRLVNELSANGGTTAPESLIALMDRITTEPVRKLMAAAQANRAELAMETARLRNELLMAQADMANNLAQGIEAETMDAVLDAIDDYEDKVEDVTKTLSQVLGETWENIVVSDVMAEAMGNQELAGQALGDVLNAAAFLDAAKQAAADGASAEEVANMTDAALVAFMANLLASLGAISATMVDANGAITAEGENLNNTIANLDGLLNSVANMKRFEIKAAPAKATNSGRYKPKKAGGGGKGKSAKDEARKLKEDFEKELRDVQKELLGLETEILKFDDTIDFTARFSAMIDIDRREIALKYDQKIQEIQSDIEAANEKFKAQPAYLSQLTTGYNELIKQLERAKQAEMDYTNTFTYQSKLRNEAIDRQIDAIRNLSMEGEKAGVAILDGVRAGFLQYQKDMKTTVDNVAQATVGVLDGLAEAVGAFVTGTGDAMEILRNAVLSSLNELIVNATKRMMQTMLEGLTGGGITNGLSGAGAAAGGAAGGQGGGGFWSSIGSMFGFGGGKTQTTEGSGGAGGAAAALAGAQSEAAQMQIVFSQFIVQLQTTLTAFITQLTTALQTANLGGQGQGGVPDMTGTGGTTTGGGNAGGTATAAPDMSNMMGGFMQNIMGMFQSLFGGLGSMLQGLFSNILGMLGGGGGFMGLFDAGGSIPGGKWGIAGEFGPEIIRGPANVTGRENTMEMFRDAANRSAPAPVQAPPTVNNIIVQDQSVVARYLSTSAGKRQIGNVVRQTQNPAN